MFERNKDRQRHAKSVALSSRVMSPAIYNVSNGFTYIGSLASLDGPFIINSLLFSQAHPSATSAPQCIAWSAASERERRRYRYLQGGLMHCFPPVKNVKNEHHLLGGMHWRYKKPNYNVSIEQGMCLAV